MPGGMSACPRVTPGLLSHVSLPPPNLQAFLPEWEDSSLTPSPWGGAGTGCFFGEVGAAALPEGSSLCPSEGNQSMATLTRGQSKARGSCPPPRLSCPCLGA